MRKLFSVIVMMAIAVMMAPAQAADIPMYPPVPDIPDLPPVDYGLGGSFYLRGSIGGNLLVGSTVIHGCCSFTPDDVGYGYSVGAGIGYETGDGLRVDVTLDYLYNYGMHITKAVGDVAVDGNYTLKLNTGLFLANAYYDFGLGGDGYSAAGGWLAFVGAGIGAAYNTMSVDTDAACGVGCVADGSNWTPAAAVMAGVGYDMGSLVAELEYRGIYLPQISNNAASPPYINDNFIHEVRTSLRYRFN